jgi:hypothetical protein
MSKNKTTKEWIVELHMENQQQTKSIDNLVDVMSAHDKESQVYRQKTVKNESNIKWLTRGTLSLFGIFGSIIVWVVATILLK